MSTLAVVGFDALKDKRYAATRLGRDVADFLAWMDLGGASPRTLDQYERDLARGALMFPQKGITELSDGGKSGATQWLLRTECGCLPAAVRRTSLRCFPTRTSGSAAVSTGRPRDDPVPDDCG